MNQADVLNDIISITNVSRGLINENIQGNKQYTTGKITPGIMNPKHLRHELIKIHKQLPPKITLPENPKTNIWH